MTETTKEQDDEGEKRLRVSEARGTRGSGSRSRAGEAAESLVKARKSWRLRCGNAQCQHPLLMPGTRTRVEWSLHPCGDMRGRLT